MHKFILMIVLAFANTSAMAEWIKLGSNGSDTFYADPTTIIKSAYKVKMQTLHDYKTAIQIAGLAFLSSEVQEEYDCKKNQTRTLYFSFRSRNLGKGRKVYSEADPHEWEPVRTGSIRETLLKFACKRSK